MSSSKLIDKVSFQEVDAILVSSAFQVAYLTGYSNFSHEEREAFVLLTPQTNYIFTDARYSEAVSQIPGFSLMEVSGQVTFTDHLKKIIDEYSLKSLGIEGDHLTVSEFRRLEKVISEIKEIKLVDLRAEKKVTEIQKIEQACQIGDQVFKVILKKIKAGMTEKKLALEMELLMRKKGVVPSFDTIVAFGSHSYVPHHQTGDTKLIGQGEFVLLDFGIKFEEYCSDMTRTIFLGKASEKQKKIYQAVLAAQSKAAEFLDSQIKKGIKVTGKKVDQVAREYIISKGYPSIPHSLGHGIGLQVHEYPRLSPKSDDVLIEGMVFSIEPGIYIPGFGGVRIEDLYVIEKTGLRQLTQASKELIEL
jgi:Xaa-Pro aminopeptidase